MGYSVEVDNEEQAEKLQEIAFEQGFEWRYGVNKIQHLDERSFQFGYNIDMVITFNFNEKEHYQDYFITKTAHFNDLFETKFTPIAMKCTQEQFDAIKPKLKGLKVTNISSFSDCDYLVNNLGGERKLISNVMYHAKTDRNRVAHEEWNEEIFLKACGIEVYSLEQQLEKAKAEVERLEKLINAKNELKRIQKLIESLEDESKN